MKLKKRIKNEVHLPSIINGFIDTVGLGKEKKSSGYICWVILATGSFVLCCCLQTVALFTAEDSERFFECFSVLGFCSMGLFKLYSIRVHRSRWLNIIALMEQIENLQTQTETPDEEYDSDDDSFDFNGLIEEYTKQSQSTSLLLSRVYKSTAVGFMLSPFIEYIYLKVTNLERDYPHILPCWWPLGDKYDSVYAGTIGLECIAACYCVLVHLAFDRSSAGVMIFTRSQFLLLRRYCENIAGSGRQCFLNERRDARAMYRIRQSHTLSVILIDIVAEIRKILQNIMGIYYLGVTLTLCTVAMRFKTEVLSIPQLISLLQYLGATLTQLFLFCYYGNAVYDASSMGLGEGPSGCAHWCVGPRVRRHLALLSIGMTRPRRLRAGPFHYLDLPAFTTILRAAYSYYAILGK